MKKFLSLLVLLVAFSSCEEDIQFNTPAVQGLKDNELWKATEYRAILGGGGSLTIEATNGFETVVLKTVSSTPGMSFQLGVNEVNKATYSLNADGLSYDYQTGTDLGDGLIEISDNPIETDITKGYITGTFRFNASDEFGELVNFQNGFFYKVPIQAAP
ncbi:hypothetical protein DVK85_03990 [Flavobacterium arcticum]|uniref:DUF5004 domain-containing protein n=1 Tax=Flavobacterium arcticum TaxID=1784713 RepID=A0A345HA26_9FLAO|nr:DUF6252 family protein [Flavobacterium arcticum]AXG73436.1 hypothetical protein DVK85_03990 [Flavobacterium arcticum]KAF2513223.1 hypothetical protein E0W72_02040 [Flavobacterium arcticum]